jgi:hypothetical protein
MSQVINEHIGSFGALYEGEVPYEVQVFQDFHEGRTSTGVYRIAGIKSLRLPDGTLVNRLEKGRYEVDSVAGSFILTSDDPHAE